MTCRAKRGQDDKFREGFKMIADALILLKDQLNNHFKSFSTDTNAGAGEDKVVLMEGDQLTDSASFKKGYVTVMLYRIEQETALRQGDAYVRVSANGTQKVQPDLCLNLYAVSYTHLTLPTKRIV